MAGVIVGGWADAPSLTTYASNFEVFGGRVNSTTGEVIDWWDGAARMPASFGDGTSNTILFAERPGVYGKYMDDGSQPPASGGNVWNWWGLDSAMPSFAVDNTGWGNMAVAVGPNSTFQDQPFPFETNCSVWRASTPQTGAMVVAMADSGPGGPCWGLPAEPRQRPGVLIRSSKPWSRTTTGPARPCSRSLVVGTFTARVFERDLAGRLLTFASINGRLTNSETGGSWEPVTGRAVAGPFAGQSLTPLPAVAAFRDAWLRFFPRSD